MKEQPKERKITIGRKLLWVLLAGAFALGVFFGTGLWLFGDRDAVRSERSLEDFAYIRPSIAETAPEARKIRELKPFRYKVEALIRSKLEDEEASSVSIYFRDLDNGNWFGIREDEKFSPEIQLKLPILIAYFKWAETNPLVLRKKIFYRGVGGPFEPRYLRSPKPLVPDRDYTVNELLLRMTAYGDDSAYALLLASLPPKYLHKVAKDLYVNYDPGKSDDSLTLNAYASYFRVLFNASYLNEEMSEKALRYLARSVFRDGMAAGVPPEIGVASKAGERVLESPGDGEVLQLHEFGIIYHPGRPFLLGITVRGSDFHDLARVIRDITSLVYEEVDIQSGSDEP
ncbi:MAG: serine hydrolase [Nitrospirota bacterium]